MEVQDQDYVRGAHNTVVETQGGHGQRFVHLDAAVTDEFLNSSNDVMPGVYARQGTNL